jgi:hypothetical protein
MGLGPPLDGELMTASFIAAIGNDKMLPSRGNASKRVLHLSRRFLAIAGLLTLIAAV